MTLQAKWYQQFWPWFLILLPASVVVASIATIYIASQHADSLVVDDYYKNGLTINQDLSLYKNARELNIKAELIFHKNGQIIVEFDQAPHLDTQQLTLLISHPTLPDEDRRLVLHRQNSLRFTAQTENLSSGYRDIQLSSSRPPWKIGRRIRIDEQLTRLHM